MKKYDVIIIGGGIGGLTSGIILSKEGLSVCVLEQHSVIGGCLQSFKRHGRTLDTGMHYIGSMGEGEIMHQYFKYFGITDDLRLRKLSDDGFDYFHFMDGEVYSHASGNERFVDTLASRFPEDRKGIETIVGKMQNIGDMIAPEVLREGKLYNRGGKDYTSVSAYGEIEKAISNDRLRNVMAGNTGLYAGNRLTTSMYEYGVITHSYIQGAYAFEDGSQQLADLMVRQIERNGGEVHLNARVQKIHLEGDKAEYVELTSGERLYGERVISSIHPSTTFSMLENNTIYKKAFFTRMNSLANTYGIFTTYLLMKPNTVKYENNNHFYFNIDDVWGLEGMYKGVNIPGVLMCMQPNSRNEYTEVISLLVPMPFEQCARWADTTVGRRGEDYKAFKEQFGNAVIDFVSQFNPSLKGNIEMIHTASPLTYRDYTSTPEGSAYGLVKDCRNPLASLVFARTKISNLLITGQSLNIHGCLGATISSAVTCSEILGEEYLAKKIGNA
ncbi:MAG: NAD(P)/FAD-dependent oxidoreductase [Alistipes sp.]|nr:NAD(P)/FAD-dependent oxidoreductase [Alistipes sp.]